MSMLGAQAMSRGGHQAAVEMADDIAGEHLLRAGDAGQVLLQRLREGAGVVQRVAGLAGGEVGDAAVALGEHHADGDGKYRAGVADAHVVAPEKGAQAEEGEEHLPHGDEVHDLGGGVVVARLAGHDRVVHGSRL